MKKLVDPIISPSEVYWRQQEAQWESLTPWLSLAWVLIAVTTAGVITLKFLEAIYA